MTRSRIAIGVIGLCLMLVVAACLVWKPDSGSSRLTPRIHRLVVVPGKPWPGLRFRLEQDGDAPALQEQAADVAGTPLSPGRIASIVSRLPPLAAQPADRAAFALRKDRPPPAGRSVTAVFPAPASPAPPEIWPARLAVTRHAPQGEVPPTAHVSLSFSQPMVAVSAHAASTRSEIARLTPQPQGQWRWLGAQTLLFEPLAGSLPMATEFTVEVPAGIAAANGALLERGLRWTFKTPAPKVEQFEPQGAPVGLDALLFARFDQRIDPKRVLATIALRAAGRSLPVRLATGAEIARDARMKRRCERAEQGRYLVFRAQQPLPKASKIEVLVGPGTPSAEGPRKSAAAQRFGLQTYAPLRVAEQSCEWNGWCRAGNPWQITFSNPLDEASIKPDLIRVEPALPGMRVLVGGSTITIAGATTRRRYDVTVSAGLRDQFGQALGEDAVVRFDVQGVPPSLSADMNMMSVLDSSAAPSYWVRSVNHDELRVRVYAVQPQDYPAYEHYVDAMDETGPEPRAPGKLVSDTIVEVAAQPDMEVETRIDLAPALPHGRGHVIVVIDPREPWRRTEGWKRPHIYRWLQATRIGLSAFSDREALVGWASSLADGASLPGVELSLWPEGARARTGMDGLASLALGSQGARMLLARLPQADGTDDVALLPHGQVGLGGNWHHTTPDDSLLWYVADDRGTYRPGEQVHVKGWLRRRGSGRDDTLQLPARIAGQSASVSWRLREARGGEIAHGEAALNALCGFALSVQLPENVALGDARFELEVRGLGHAPPAQHSFAVQEFRRPEFEVRVQAEPGPHFVGQSARLTAHATYYAGGGLSLAQAEWRVAAAPIAFVPPGRSDYAFGSEESSWHMPHSASIPAADEMHFWKVGVPWRPPRDVRTEPQMLQGRTTHAGEHALRVHFTSVEPPEPQWLEARAWVKDRNRRRASGWTGVIVHPAAVYVGLRSDRYFVEAGQALEVDAIAVDLDGKLVSGRPITVRAARLETVDQFGEALEQERDAQDCTIVSAPDAVRCTFRPERPGRYRIRATVRDQSGRAHATQFERWVAAEPGVPWSPASLDPETALLLASQEQYSPGQTAELLLRAPFYPAEGTLCLEGQGILRTERFRLTGPSQTLRVPIEEGFAPGVVAAVELVGTAERSDAHGRPLGKGVREPAHASGRVSLRVAPRGQALTLQLTPRQATLPPGGSTVVDVTVNDADQRPVAGAEVALVVADEAVLALRAHELGDPLAAFYPERASGVAHFRLRDHMLSAAPKAGRPGAGAKEDAALDQPGEIIVTGSRRDLDQPGEIIVTGSRRALDEPLEAVKLAPSAKSARHKAELSAARRASAPPLAMRRDFAALALFAPELRSDANGRIAVTVKLPDNLTRYRVMAVAAQGARRFGGAESLITARLPLMVRPSAPRFLNFGDRFELPVLLQNQTDRALRVDVAVRASNAEPAMPWGRRVNVPANDRVELLVPAAAQSPGTARFQFGAVAAALSDAAEVSLPVWTPATREAFASYGVLEHGAIAQPIAAPPDVFPQFGGLELSTSSTALQGLTDAVLYLTKYPHECNEQIASRLLAIASLRDVLAAFGAKELPSPAQLDALVAADLEGLQQLQNRDGGWSFWDKDTPGWPHLAIHVTHALARARRKGLAVQHKMLEAARDHLRRIDGFIPAVYGAPVRHNLLAHALRVRKLLGDPVAPEARALIAKLDLARTDVETLGLLYSALAGDPASSAQRSAIRRQLDNRVEQTAATAHFKSSFGDDGYLLLHSERRADAVVLEALIEDQPQSDLIPKLVAGLLAQRQAGRWASTQENALVLAALDTYFRRYEADSPDMVARAWLGRQFAGEQRYEGRSAEPQRIEVPMAELRAQPASELIVEKQGAGRLYYRVAMQYAQNTHSSEPRDAGFALERHYEAMDTPSDVQRAADGSWQVRAGARVRIRVRIAAQARRYHVALVDPMPAGLEAIDPELAATAADAQDAPGSRARPERSGLWTRWYEHQNLRDNRAEAFSSVLREGEYEYVYVARATTPGVFVAPPARAEEMYRPETFGCSASDTVRVQ